jgi:hypothetical protein
MSGGSHAIPITMDLLVVYSRFYRFPYSAPPKSSSDPISRIGYPCFRLIS